MVAKYKSFLVFAMSKVFKPILALYFAVKTF